MSLRNPQDFDIRWFLNWLQNNDLINQCEGVLHAHIPAQIIGKTTPYSMQFGKYLDLVNAISDYLDDEYLGLKIGKETQIVDFGFVGSAMLFSPTIKDSLLMLPKYVFTISPAIRIKLDFDYTEDSCCVSYEIPAHQHALMKCKHDFDLTMGALVLFFKRFIDKDWLPKATLLRYEPPQDVTPYYQLFGKNIQFSQSSNSIIINKTDLQYPVCEQENGYLLRIMVEHLDTLLGELPHKQSLLANVRYQIIHNLGTENCTAPAIAKSLYISHRTLNRELELADTSFRTLKVSTIIDVAKRALKESSSNITHISLKLGYVETSSFIRVFKKETGISPYQYRKQYRQ